MSPETAESEPTTTIAAEVTTTASTTTTVASTTTAETTTQPPPTTEATTTVPDEAGDVVVVEYCTALEEIDNFFDADFPDDADLQAAVDEQKVCYSNRATRGPSTIICMHVIWGHG